MKALLKKAVLLVFLLFLPAEIFCGQPYVLLVSLDGFRYDYANRRLTPNLEKMMQQGASALSLQPVFPSATFPNHVSIATGMYPENHGIIANSFKNPYTGTEYTLKDSKEVQNPEWYLGEFFWTTAKRNGIMSASYFWPGSELTAKHRRPDYYEKYDEERPYMDRINGVLDWLQLPYHKRPHFMTLYFHETDSRGHQYGPDSPRIDSSIALADSLVGEVFKGLHRINMKDSVNVIVVSDHGMTEVDSVRQVDLDYILKDVDYEVQNYGAFAMISPVDGNSEQIMDSLKNCADHYSVYRKENIPQRLHYSKHPFISEIFVLADPGWMLIRGSENKSYSLKGAHGYDNSWINMHGIFFAEGPAFKEGFRTGTLRCIDIYPLLCEIFDIEEAGNIDGDIEKIRQILKEK